MILVAISHYSCVKEEGRLEIVSPCDSVNSKYSEVILPMMQANCAISGCHDGTGGAPGDFGTYADVKAVADNGKLADRVIVLKNMPPAGPLPDSLILKLNCWLGKGAQNN